MWTGKDGAPLQVVAGQTLPTPGTDCHDIVAIEKLTSDRT